MLNYRETHLEMVRKYDLLFVQLKHLEEDYNNALASLEPLIKKLQAYEKKYGKIKDKEIVA